MERKGLLVDEMLPYLRKYHGKIIVIKYGRNEKKRLKTAHAQDIVDLKYMGLNPVIVHGGGPKISQRMRKRGIEPVFNKDGLRVTNKETLKIAMQVFEEISLDIVETLTSVGGMASCVSGSCVFEARQISKILGYVGEITDVNDLDIGYLLSHNLIPVVSPISLGVDKAKKTYYNINADTATAELSIALGAEKMIMVTDVDGIKENDNLISHLNLSSLRQKVEQGVIKGGMVPKARACIKALDSDVPKCHIINGTHKHSLLLEVFTNKGIGTEITA